MSVRELMSPSFSAIEADSALVDAFRVVEDRGLRALLAMESGQVCGVVLSRDITRQFITDEEAASRRQVREVMNRKVASCCADTSVSKAKAFVEERGFQHLLVCSSDKHVIGLLSAADLQREARS